MSEDQNVLVSRVQFALKVMELSLSVVCMGLIVDPMNHKLQMNLHHIGLVYVAYAGFILINTIVIIGQTRAERMPQFMWMLFSLTGGVLSLVAGSVTINNWRNLWRGLKHMGYSKQYMDMMIASGIIGIFNGFFYLADFGLTVALAGTSE